jgi:hypothetical protein
MHVAEILLEVAINTIILTLALIEDTRHVYNALMCYPLKDLVFSHVNLHSLI